MKGKYATRAQSTQARVNAQQRAEVNERRVQVLEGQITKMGAEHAKVVHGLEKDLAVAIEQRDAASSPSLAKARQRIVDLESERAYLQGQIGSIKGSWKTARSRLHPILVALGMTEREAAECLQNAFGLVVKVARNAPEKIISEPAGAEVARSLRR